MLLLGLLKGMLLVESICLIDPLILYLDKKIQRTDFSELGGLLYLCNKVGDCPFFTFLTGVTPDLTVVNSLKTNQC